jgi:hypothetical protein
VCEVHFNIAMCYFRMNNMETAYKSLRLAEKFKMTEAHNSIKEAIRGKLNNVSGSLLFLIFSYVTFFVHG